MTEEEAKTKWCPFVQQSPQAAHSNRGDHPNATNVNCIGSACMTWRWQTDKGPTRILHRKGEEPVITTEVEHGFCGLAGKP